MDTVTHVAGLIIDWRGRTIQRCAICGQVLVDSQACLVAGGGDVGTWEAGRLVQQTVGQNPTRWSLLPESDKLPDDNCFALVEK